MSEMASYFPYIVPAEEWAKRSLLMFDTIGSIVPNYQWRDLARRGSAVFAQLDWLRSEDIWHPLTAADGLDETYEAEVQDVLLTMAGRDDIRFTKEFRPPDESVDVLLRDKLAHRVQRDLAALDMIEVCRSRLVCSPGRFLGDSCGDGSTPRVQRDNQTSRGK